MRADVIVLSEPLVDDDVSLLCRRELFGIENPATKSAVEAPFALPLPQVIAKRPLVCRLASSRYPSF